VSTVDLARLEFAVTANVHFLFVLLTLGLAPLIAVLQTRYAVTGSPEQLRMTKFWGQLYVVNYGLGIVTGLVMEFQFSLDWTGVSRVTGQVFGAPMAMEAIVAFFAESTFLGIWIFGWNVLPRAVHLIAFYIVTLTAFASTYFILVANGFLHHPTGYRLSHGAATITDFGALASNPAGMLAMGHVLAAALLTGGLLMAGVSCLHLCRGGDETEFIGSLRTGVVAAVIGALPTIGLGFAQLDRVQVDQPLKYDAINGRPVAAGGPPGWLTGPFHAMQGIGFACAAVALLMIPMLFGRWVLRRPRLLGIVPFVIPLPFVAAVCGWLVREIGRQPWVIYGVLRTPDGLSGIGTAQVALSLAVFSVIVLALAVTNWVLLARLAGRGPDAVVLGAELGDREDDADESPIDVLTLR
jgi:cytochrome d ubiquinol oxidase subunit I